MFWFKYKLQVVYVGFKNYETIKSLRNFLYKTVLKEYLRKFGSEQFRERKS